MSYFDVTFLIFAAFIVWIFYKKNALDPLWASISFLVALAAGLTLFDNFLSFIEKAGWKENVFSPPLILITGTMLIWGLCYAILLNSVELKSKNIIVNVCSSITFAFLVSVFISTLGTKFITSEKLLGQIDRSLLFSSRNICSKYMGEKLTVFDNYLVKWTILSKQDREAISLSEIDTSSALISEKDAELVFALTNKTRSEQGLRPFTRDKSLDILAQSYAQSISKTKYFSHYDQQGNGVEDRAENRHVRYNYIGENLALAKSATIAHKALLESASHKQNIVSKVFQKMGVGVVDIGLGGKIIVEEFTN